MRTFLCPTRQTPTLRASTPALCSEWVSPSLAKSRFWTLTPDTERLLEKHGSLVLFRQEYDVCDLWLESARCIVMDNS